MVQISKDKYDYLKFQFSNKEGLYIVVQLVVGLLLSAPILKVCEKIHLMVHGSMHYLDLDPNMVPYKTHDLYDQCSRRSYC